MIEVVQLKEASEQVVVDISKLLPQLRSDASEHSASLAELRAIVADDNTILMVAKDGGTIVGMAALYLITKFSKRSGFVEDVVVDSAYRGQKLGERLVQSLIDAAKREQVKQLYLTSTADRIAAHKLYEKLGFKQRQTDVFKLVI